MSKKAYHRPSKGQAPYSVSQNYLTSVRIIEQLIRRTDLRTSDHVWEIGAGKGHITGRLLRHCGQVTAVEIDPALHQSLRGKFVGETNLRLLRGDFLHVPLPAHGDYKVFANIPFCITSAILHKLTTAPNPPKDCWLLMEKGAAKRFSGLPQDTLQSLLIKPFFTAGIRFYVPREAFHPMPSVDVVMLHLHRKDIPDISPRDRPLLESFLREMQGRQAPSSAKKPQRSSPACRQTLAGRRASISIPQSATMDYVQWLCLFRSWAHLHGKNI